MIFTLTELEHHPIHFDVTYRPGEIRFGEDLHQDGDLRAEGSATLFRNTLGEVRVRGRLKVTMSAVCDRCLEQALLPIDSEFDFFYRPLEKSGSHGEVHLEEGEIDISFYEGEGVQLEDALREFVLLTQPMQLLCRPDCQGICPACGANRNETECGCEPAGGDQRWSALKNL